MRALRHHREDGSLKVEDVPSLPQPQGGDVLIQVKATAITNGELEWPETKEREFPIPGHDVAGIIVAVGPEVTGFAPGDEVFALTSFSRDGAAADHLLASSTELAIKPSSLTWEECASIPLSALTAYQALLTHADAQPGQKVLITGAGGGVGVMAVQLAVAARLKVTAVCSASKAELVKDLGAHEVVDYRTRPLRTLSHDYDIVLDCVGGSTLGQLFPLLKGRGQMICVARPATAEEKAQRPDVPATFFVVEPDGEELTRVAQCVEQEHVRAVVGEVFPLERGEEAFAALGKGGVAGKIVLAVDQRVDSPKAGL